MHEAAGVPHEQRRFPVQEREDADLQAAVDEMQLFRLALRVGNLGPVVADAARVVPDAVAVLPDQEKFVGVPRQGDVRGESATQRRLVGQRASPRDLLLFAGEHVQPHVDRRDHQFGGGGERDQRLPRGREGEIDGENRTLDDRDRRREFRAEAGDAELLFRRPLHHAVLVVRLRSDGDGPHRGGNVQWLLELDRETNVEQADRAVGETEDPARAVGRG